MRTSRDTSSRKSWWQSYMGRHFYRNFRPTYPAMKMNPRWRMYRCQPGVKSLGYWNGAPGSQQCWASSPSLVHVVGSEIFLPHGFGTILFHHGRCDQQLRSLQEPERRTMGGSHSRGDEGVCGLADFYGNSQPPQLSNFWSDHPGLGVLLFKNTILRWRFEKLKQYFHISDRASELPCGHPNFDKLQKVRPILNLLSKTFRDFYVPGRYLSVDEAMCAFRGQISFLQYMPLKLIKRGIKVWMCSVPGLGYTSTFDVYTGKGASISEKGLSYDVVTKLVQSFYRTFRCVVFDNLFTGIHLLRELLRNGTYSVGTFRQNRKGFPVDLKNFRLKLKESEMRQCAQLIAAIWKDKGKSNVTTLSTGHPPFVGDVRQRTGAAVNVVNCPKQIIEYNKYMGGVDLADQLQSYYSMGRQSRKWWTYLFWFFINTVIVNAYVLYTISQYPLPEHPMTQLQFRIKVAIELIGGYSGYKRNLKRQNPDDVPVAQENLLLHSCVTMPRRKKACCQCLRQNRRTLCGGRVESVYGCHLCNIHTCRDCFAAYHADAAGVGE